MSSKEFLEELKTWTVAYDKDCGSYPENTYEGLSVYNFIAEKMGLPVYSYEYYDELKKEFADEPSM